MQIFNFLLRINWQADYKIWLNIPERDAFLLLVHIIGHLFCQKRKYQNTILRTFSKGIFDTFCYLHLVKTQM
jgi:hypothetical protein